MTPARRLVWFRGALCAFGAMTVPLIFSAAPTFQQVADGLRTTRGDLIDALLITGAWWASFLAMWFIEERRLRANRHEQAG